MSVPAISLSFPLIDSGSGTRATTRGLREELLERASRDDYPQWLSLAGAAGGCVRPIRLRGTVRDLDASTGEVLHALDTKDTPDKVIYLPCRDRRASVCPPCAATYRADTFQLIRAGLAAGKASPNRSRCTRVCSPPSPPPALALSTPGLNNRTARLPGAGHGARPATARTGASSRAGEGTKRTTPAWDSRSARRHSRADGACRRGQRRRSRRRWTRERRPPASHAGPERDLRQRIAAIPGLGAIGTQALSGTDGAELMPLIAAGLDAIECSELPKTAKRDLTSMFIDNLIHDTARRHSELLLMLRLATSGDHTG